MSERRMGPLIATLAALVAAGGAYCLFAIGLLTIETNGYSGGRMEMRMMALLLATIAGVVVLRGPVGRAIARLLEGGGQEVGNAELEQRVHELEERLAQGEHDRGRIDELAERLDFAERLLARNTAEPAKLGGPRP